jgi:hypothetical protein
MENSTTIVTLAPVIDPETKRNRVRGAITNFCIPVSAKKGQTSVCPITEKQFETDPSYSGLRQEYGNYKNFCSFYSFIMGDSKVHFDLSNPIDKLNYDICRLSPYVAISENHISTSTRYVIHNPEEKNIQKIKKFNLLKEAMDLISKMTDQEKFDLLYLFGYDAEKMTVSAKEAKVAEIVETKPEEFIKKANNKLRYNLIFISKCINKNIIKNVGGIYRFNEVSLGTTIDLVIDFLSKPENELIYEEISQELAFS